MLSAEERLGRIRIKVERAHKHISDLSTAVQTFKSLKPYEIGTKPDPQFPNGFIYYLIKAPKVPLPISAIAGDAIQNLRSALDYLAFALVEKRGFVDVTGTPLKPKDIRDTSFPIIDTDDSTKYKTDSERKIKGMSKAAQDAIHATKPYKGGNHTLWRLHKFNNIDKHNFLVTAAFAIEIQSLKLMLSTQPYEIIFRPGIQKCPLEDGDELAIVRSRTTSKIDENLDFAFEVALNQPEIVECQPLVPTLVQTLQYIDGLILSFRDHLK